MKQISKAVFIKNLVGAKIQSYAEVSNQEAIEEIGDLDLPEIEVEGHLVNTLVVLGTNENWVYGGNEELPLEISFAVVYGLPYSHPLFKEHDHRAISIKRGDSFYRNLHYSEFRIAKQLFEVVDEDGEILSSEDLLDIVSENTEILKFDLSVLMNNSELMSKEKILLEEVV